MTKPFDYTLDWHKPEPQIVLEIIQAVGIHRLANFDGCLCGRFSLRNVDIDICCGKGRQRALWISSKSGDYDDNAQKKLRPIAEEVVRQVQDLNDGRGEMPTRFDAWSREKEAAYGVSS
jgi:hypothetical protein